MATKIVTKNSSTASAVPTASDLVQGELAVNVADKRLFTEDNGGAIVELGTNPSGNVTFQDNGKAIFGAGSDLQIYHDGSNSYVTDEGTGSLYIRGSSQVRVETPTGENMAIFNDNGGVSLRYNNAKKFETTSTGIDVTGSVKAAGLEVGTSSDSYSAVYILSSITGESELRMGDTDTDAGSIAYTNSDDTMTFRAAAGARMTLNSTGIDVTGTATMDGLTVDKSSQATIVATSDSTVDVRLVADTSLTEGSIRTSGTTPNLGFYVGGTKYANISDGGDISFYEDTGTTAKLFWDASAESLGIGTSSPSYPLEVQSGGVGTVLRAGTSFISIDSTGSAASPSLIFNGDDDTGIYRAASDTLVIATAGSERMRIDSSGDIRLTGTAPSAEDNISTINFFNTSSNTNLASITGKRTAGGTNYGSLIFNTTNSGTLAERMRISSSGNVGIGKTPLNNNLSPALEMVSGGTMFGYGDAMYLTGNLYYNGGWKAIATGAGSSMILDGYGPRFYTNASASAGGTVTPTERMRIDASGNLLVGKTATTYSAMLEVLQAAAGTTAAGFANSHATTPYGVLVDFTGGSPDNNATSFLHCRDTTTNRLFIYSDGDVMNHDGTYGTISDERIKQDFTAANSQWDDIKGLQFYNYRKKDDVIQYGDDAPIELGVKAQEAELVSAGLVKEYALSENQAGLHPDFEDWENGTVKGVKYSIMFMKATVALQEAQTRIETLEARVTELENN